MHAAFWIDEYGALLACREDIGRHNAVDKIIGYSLVNRFQPYGASLLVTSRCSVEIVQKSYCVRCFNAYHSCFTNSVST